MIYPKISSPTCTAQRKKRQTNSGRIILGSAKSTRQDEETTPTEEPVPLRYSDLYKQQKAQAEMGNMFKKKKTYPIAPDALIPNSSCRTVFKIKEIKPIEPKAFQLRLDILDNLQNNDNKNLNGQDDDEEWAELDDPDAPPVKPASAKKTKGTLVSQKKETIPDLFKRLQNEPWWKQAKEDKPNLRSILLYLNETLKLKQNESYESACYYVIEIFRTYGIEPIFVNQILDILLDHLTKNENDRLDICTIRTIAQFMIERKDIIIRLLEYALKCQSATDIYRLETINAIKFITDINSSDDIDLVLENMPVVYDTPEDNFSLKTIIQGLESKKKPVLSDVIDEEEEAIEIHPLLKKISEERWFPRGHFILTLDFVLDAIIKKLPDSSKSMVKTLTTHLIQLHRVIGFLTEQFDRVSNSLISLLSHTDADYRLIAATNLANLEKETKAIDLALLDSFLNDARILVRTECCDSLKKLTGIMSDTVLKDCADDISYLQSLPEENFSLQNYLKEKNRLPTPPPPPVVGDEPPAEQEEEDHDDSEEEEEDIIPVNEVEPNLTIDQIELHEDTSSKIRSRSPSLQIIQQQSPVIDTLTLPVQHETARYSATPSVSSSMTSIRPSIRVEINEKHSSVTSNVPKLQKEQTKQPTSPTKTPLPDRLSRKRSSLLPNNTNMWDSYVKQNETIGQKENNESEMNYIPAPQSTVINEQQIYDPIQTIIEEHKQNVGFYRMVPNRRVLVPHKVSMDNILGDQSHILINHFPTQSPMNLSDLNHNQYHLNEVEFVQLLSSLVIRALQVHRQYEKFLPTSNTPNLMNALSVSPVQLHSSTSFQQSSVISSSRLPLIGHQRPTSRQFTRMQSNIQAKAAREGINVHRAQNMESVLSNVLKPNREQTKSTMFSSSISHPSSSKQTETTHAWLLVQLLKSQGIFNAEGYIQKILQAYPKFTPLLHTKIPENLISPIWNDAIMKQLASIFSQKRDPSSVANSSMKRSDTKPSVPTTDDDYSFNAFEYSTLINRDDHKKKYLPVIRGSKMNLPRHVLKFGFRQIDADAVELSNTSPREESRSRSRKRRVQMHLMMSANENMFDQHESIKSPVRHMIKTDYQATSFVPIVTRPPMCH